ncbi:hypothetical protein CPB83DRAFT_899013 [Crepidotus variabilis]|uniref:Uncharacterized protein n=1 Tax=Crepidotus variabilis TaxID=179855 RepID=A0A9P6E629_9AGAR|nr:hypothetical protein CPB83DRAFT_899013 [Crepidotus variabilis]
MSDIELGLVFFIKDDDPLWEDELELFDIRKNFVSVYSPIYHGSSVFKAFAATVFDTWSDYLTCAFFSTTSAWIAVATISLCIAEEPLQAQGRPLMVGVHDRIVKPGSFPFSLNLTRFSTRLSSEITDPELPWFEYEGEAYQKTLIECHHSDYNFSDWRLDISEGDIYMLDASTDMLKNPPVDWDDAEWRENDGRL